MTAAINVREPHHRPATSNGAGRIEAKRGAAGEQHGDADGNPERPDVRRRHHAQPSLPWKVGQQAVGAVHQPVEVQHAGEPEIGHHDQYRGHRWRATPWRPATTRRRRPAPCPRRQPGTRPPHADVGTAAPTERRQERHRPPEATPRRARIEGRTRGSRSSAQGFQPQGPAGDHQQHLVGHGGHRLVHLAHGVAEPATGGAGGVYPETDLVGHDHRVAHPSGEGRHEAATSTSKSGQAATQVPRASTRTVPVKPARRGTQIGTGLDGAPHSGGRRARWAAIRAAMSGRLGPRGAVAT